MPKDKNVTNQISIDIGTSSPQVDNIVRHTTLSTKGRLKEKNQILKDAKYSKVTDARRDITDFVKFEPKLSTKPSRHSSKSFLPLNKKHANSNRPAPESILCCGAVKEFLHPSKELIQLAVLKQTLWAVDAKALSNLPKLLLQSKFKDFDS